MNFTFGIITSGTFASVQNTINSIMSLNIPDENFEIIVVGGKDISHHKVKHIPFNENIKKAWITKKKQIICEEAKFDNVVLTHDYIVFDSGWYEGWKDFGDNWDVAMNRIYNGDGKRFRDWLALEPHASVPYDMVFYHPVMYISGTYWVAKKEFMLKNPLDLNRGWCEAEDIEWSMRCRPFWNYKMNTKSSVRSPKIKEDWNILDETGVQNFIHYSHIVKILNEKHNVGCFDDNGVLRLSSNQGVYSIHYTEFDKIRNLIRKEKPNTILVCGDPFGLIVFSATWAAREYGGNVITADYCNSPSQMTIINILLHQAGWESSVKLLPIESPENLPKSDMAILAGTYGVDRKNQELNVVKYNNDKVKVLIYGTNI